MSKVRHLAEGMALPEWFLDALQELLSTYTSPNFHVTQVDATTLQVVAGTNNDQVGVCMAKAGVTGWRYNTATVTATVPGGLPAGTHDIYVCARANAFAGNSSPPPTELDSTSYGFTLMLLQVGTTPSGAVGSTQELFRKVGTFLWTGSTIATVALDFGGGFTNPMTAPGDLIVGGAAGSAGRLGIGGTNTRLTSSGGVPSWQPLPPLPPVAVNFGGDPIAGKRIEAGRVTGISMTPFTGASGTVNYAAPFGSAPALVLFPDANFDVPWDRAVHVDGGSNTGFNWATQTGSSGVSNVLFSWIAVGA